MGTFLDLTGKRYGKLVVIGRSDNDKYGRAKWTCRCDCGEVRTENSSNLVRGYVKSCGCERAKILRSVSITHGQRKTRLYGVWSNLKTRCYNPKTHNYHRYGGRGITVCDEWINDFQAFYDWAIANGYDENAPYMKCTIDRIDNDKGYSPDNCRWVDAKTQNNNKSNSKRSVKR